MRWEDLGEGWQDKYRDAWKRLSDFRHCLGGTIGKDQKPGYGQPDYVSWQKLMDYAIRPAREAGLEWVTSCWEPCDPKQVGVRGEMIDLETGCIIYASETTRTPEWIRHHCTEQRGKKQIDTDVTIEGHDSPKGWGKAVTYLSRYLGLHAFGLATADHDGATDEPGRYAPTEEPRRESDSGAVIAAVSTAGPESIGGAAPLFSEGGEVLREKKPGTYKGKHISQLSDPYIQAVLDRPESVTPEDVAMAQRQKAARAIRQRGDVIKVSS